MSVIKSVIGIAFSISMLTTNPVAGARPASFNEEIMAPFAATANEMSAKYGFPSILISVGPVSDPAHVAEVLDNGELRVSEEYATMTVPEFNAQIQDDIDSGFQPAGCDPIREVSLHEVGHVIDTRAHWAPRKALMDLTAVNPLPVEGLNGQALRPDGTLDPTEALAVAFAAVECGSVNPTYLQIHGMLLN